MMARSCKTHCFRFELIVLNNIYAKHVLIIIICIYLVFHFVWILSNSFRILLSFVLRHCRGCLDLFLSSTLMIRHFLCFCSLNSLSPCILAKLAIVPSCVLLLAFLRAILIFLLGFSAQCSSPLSFQGLLNELSQVLSLVRWHIFLGGLLFRK